MKKFYLLVSFLCASSMLHAQEINFELNTAVKNQMNVTQPEPGTYNITTTGGDPWILTRELTQSYDPNKVYVVSFEYEAPQGLDKLELRYRENSGSFNGTTRKLDLGALPATKGLSTYKIFIKLQTGEWDKSYSIFRFDFGITANQSIQVKNLALRAPTLLEVVEIDLDPSISNLMNITDNEDGTYSIETLGGDPWVSSLPVSQKYAHEQTHVLSFQYKAVNDNGAFGIDDVQIFYGAPFAGARSVILGQQPAAATWLTATVDLKLKAPEWNQAYDIFRFDFGRMAGLNIEVRNLALREPTPAEILAATPETFIPISLNLNSAAQMNAVLNPDGSYTLETQGNDPRITSNTIDKVYDHTETFYMTFEYIATQGLDELSIFYGAPSPLRRVVPGKLEPTDTYKTVKVNMNRLDTWNSMFPQFRFDFGISPGQIINVKNIVLRKPTQEELDNDPIVQNQKNNTFLTNYFNADFSSKVNEVKVDKEKVFVETTIPNNTGNLYLAELKMFNAIFEPQDITFAVPLSSEENLTTALERYITVDGEQYDRIYSRWVIAEKDGENYKYVSHARFPDDVYQTALKYLPEEKPASIKGIGASAGPEVANDLLDLGTKNVRTGIVYGTLLSLTPTSVSYEFNGKTYYFDENYVNRLDERFRNSTENGFTSTVILLIPSNPEPQKKAILTHPDAEPGAFYSIANVTNMTGVSYYAAITSFLAERYTTPEIKITNWVIHNEVDAASEWTNAGDKPMDVYTELYDRSMRTAYYAVRQYDPAAKVFISLTQFWNAAFDYPPRLMLETLNKLSDTGGDYEWGIAHHPYPQNGREPWNDIQVTNDLNTSPKITPRNIELMDTWIRSKENLYKGLKVRSLMFTEQGINAGSSYDDETFQQQAAGVAYMWKKFSRLPSIEAIHYHRLVDNSSLFPVYFGFWTRDENSTGPEKRGVKKPSWFVWQAAGTSQEEGAFKFALPIINVSSWEETFNPIVGEVDLCNVTFALVNDEAPVDGTAIYFNGEMHYSESGGKAIFFNAASLDLERTISYVSNDTLLWPEETVVVQNSKAIFKDLKPVESLKAVGVSPTEIVLNWTDITNFEDGFVLERKAESEMSFSLLDSVAANTTSYLDQGLTSGTRYAYRIRAYNEEVNTLNSAEVETVAPFILVDYKDGDKEKPDSEKIRPHIILRNEAENSVDLKMVTVRYWFTEEDYSSLIFKAEQTGIFAKELLFGEFTAVQPALDGADYYLEISFAEGAKLPGLGSSGEIRMKIEKSIPSAFNELNDYSFASVSAYQETDKITVYWDGELIWGEEPGEASASLEEPEEQANSSLLAVYPNPSIGSTRIKWNGEIQQTGVFRLIDIYGNSHEVKVGEKTIDELSLQFLNLRAGIYILKGSINGESITHRILLVE